MMCGSFLKVVLFSTCLFSVGIVTIEFCNMENLNLIC